MLSFNDRFTFQILKRNNFLILISEESEIFGFIRFSIMNRNVINAQFIKNGFKSHCWVCKQKFTLIGVEKDANFLAGVCGCNYEYEAL
jgi:hypothetical protein